METRNYINNYLMFMWNHWNYATCMEIFGEILGKHIWWEKWLKINESYGSAGGVAILWSALDGECQQKLADKANDYYKTPNLEL